MHRGKADANHYEVIAWYRDLGCTVADTKNAGLGVPDLFVGCVGLCEAVEVKTEEGRLLSSQENFMAAWRGGRIAVVKTQDDVINHVQAMRKRARIAP